MKVLWFVNTPPSGPASDDSRGGGWMSALSAALRGREDVELGIAFFAPRGGMSPESGSPGLFPLVRPLFITLDESYAGIDILNIQDGFS